MKGKKLPNSTRPTKDKLIVKEQLEWMKRLNKRMIQLGLNQAELARRAGFGKDRIHSYVNDGGRPRQNKRQRLAKALEVSMDELLHMMYPHTMDKPQPEQPPSQPRPEVTMKGNFNSDMVEITFKVSAAKAMEMMELAHSLR